MPSSRSFPRWFGAARLPGVVALLLGSVALTACNVQSASDDLGTLPGQPKAMLADDFDGDGTDDVLIGYGGDYLGITAATQDGYGFWSRHDLGTLVLGSELMASTDLEGDGAPDVIAAARGLDSFNVLRNRGDGTFDNSVKAVAPASPDGSTHISAITSATASSGTRLVAVAFSTDDPDAFVKPRSVVTYRASGGDLTNANIFQLFDPVPGDARVLKLHDVDADGRLDLLVGTATGTVQIYRGSGADGSFATAPTTLSAAGHSAPVTALTAGDARTIEAAPADWSLDGHGDVLATFADGSEVYGWRGRGGMAFDPAEAMGVINGGSRRFFELAILPDGSGGWGGLATGQASAFAQTNGGYGFANVRPGGQSDVCDVTTGALFPNDAPDVPFAGALACAHAQSPRAVVVVPGRARLTVPQSLALGSVRAGTDGAVTTATLTQTDRDPLGGLGSGAVGIEGVRIEGEDAGDFEVVRGATGHCYLPTLPEDEPCRPQVRFAPGSPGPKQATLVIESSAYRAPGTPPHSIALSGTGTGAVASAPTTLALGDVAFGSPASTSLVVTNTGNEPLAISSLSLEDATAGWSVSAGSCAAAVAPGESCSAEVTYAPAGTGPASASLRIAGDGVGPEPVVALSARGIGSGVTAAPVAFGSVAVGDTAGATAEIVNSGGIALQISSIVAAGPDAARVTVDPGDCVGAPIAPGDGCDVGLTFAPGSRGALDATLRVTSNAPSSPNVVALSGHGLQGLAQAPDEVSLGPVGVGFFAEREVTISNAGDAPLQLGALAVEGPVELTVDGCSSTTLAVDGACAATIRFAPTVAGPLDARLLVPNDGAGGRRTVALTGLALPAQIEDPGPRNPGPESPRPENPGPSASPGAALALAVPERASVRRGSALRLRVRLHSTGERTVEGATLRVRLPAALSWRPPRRAGRGPRPTRRVILKLGSLAPGAGRTVTLTLHPRPRARRGSVRLALRATGASGTAARGTTIVQIR